MNNTFLMLLVFGFIAFGCGEKVNSVKESEGKNKSRRIEPITKSNVQEKVAPKEGKESKEKEHVRPKSKWDNLIDRKGPQGDTIGWYLSDRGYWIDTMREEKHKYNPWPHSDKGITYYPNATVYFPQKEVEINQIEKEIKIYVKTLEQKAMKWVYPLKDSKLFGKGSIRIQKIGESSSRHRTASIEIIGNDSLASLYPKAQDELYMGIKQVGDVILTEINHYKIEGYSDLVFAKTEIILYDLKGAIIGQIVRDGVGGNLTISKDLRYLFEMYGGQFTEDTKLPNKASIYDLEKKEYYWKKESLVDCISTRVKEDSNIGGISITYDCDIFSKKNRYIVVDLETNKYLEFISLDKCEIGRIGRNSLGEVFYNDETGKRIPLSWEKDFKEIKALP